ncbi:MAG: crossover junction endodeoxyribonuclease RuvC [Planctomycetota bacterium]
MRIFGIDPGTRRLGYGLIEDGGRTLRLLASGSIHARERLSLPERLFQIGQELERILADSRADAVVVEKAFYGRNVASLIAMGEGRGVALYAAARLRLEIFEYAPTEVKKAVTGRGSGRKEQVAEMVRCLLGVDQLEGGLDASDALAAAICHSQRRHLVGLEGGGWRLPRQQAGPRQGPARPKPLNDRPLQRENARLSL